MIKRRDLRASPDVNQVNLPAIPKATPTNYLRRAPMTGYALRRDEAKVRREKEQEEKERAGSTVMREQKRQRRETRRKGC